MKGIENRLTKLEHAMAPGDDFVRLLDEGTGTDHDWLRPELTLSRRSRQDDNASRHDGHHAARL